MARNTAVSVALRIDDVGACSKRYEVYSYRTWQVGKLRISANWLFLKYLPSLKAWGPYREMTGKEWYSVYKVLEEHHAKLTVAVTAAWAQNEHHLIPFPERFPAEAAALREGVEQGLIEIANHGLTHCVLKNNAFKSKWFSSNRPFHREFWNFIPIQTHEEHIRRAQDILQEYFRTDIVTFVPPGNVFTEATVEIAQRYGLRYLSCNTPRKVHGRMMSVGDEQVLPFHDRDIVFGGIHWLQELLTKNKKRKFCFIRELGEHYLQQQATDKTSEV